MQDVKLDGLCVVVANTSQAIVRRIVTFSDLYHCEVKQLVLTLWMRYVIILCLLPLTYVAGIG